MTINKILCLNRQSNFGLLVNSSICQNCNVLSVNSQALIYNDELLMLKSMHVQIKMGIKYAPNDQYF